MRKWQVLVGAVVVFCFWVLQAAAYDGTDFDGIRKLAEQGNAEAQMKLGVMLSSGVGVAKDREEGLKWYRKSADQGYPPGQWNLAFAYVRGEVLPQDFAKALELFRQAAESGYDSAQYDLGMMYLQGVGVPPDQARAEVWFRRAAAQDNREAKKILKELAASSGRK